MAVSEDANQDGVLTMGEWFRHLLGVLLGKLYQDPATEDRLTNVALGYAQRQITQLELGLQQPQIGDILNAAVAHAQAGDVVAVETRLNEAIALLPPAPVAGA